MTSVSWVLLARVERRCREEGLGLVPYVPRDGGKRDAERQKELVALGVSWTLESRHLDGEALDVTFADRKTGEAYWEHEDHEHLARAQEILREEAHALGLRTLDPETDPYHVEIPRAGWRNPLEPSAHKPSVESGPPRGNLEREEPVEAELPRTRPTPERIREPNERSPQVGSKRRGWKPKLEEIPGLVDSGKLVKVPYELRVYYVPEHEKHIGVTDDGHVVDAYLHTLLGKDVGTPLRRSKLAKFFGRIGRGAVGLLALIESPIVSVIAAKRGVNLVSAKAVVKALSHEDLEETAEELVKILGPEKLVHIYEDLKEAFDDDKLSAEEAAALLGRWT